MKYESTHKLRTSLLKVFSNENKVLPTFVVCVCVRTRARERERERKKFAILGTRQASLWEN